MKINDLLTEEEYDYYRDYKNGLISYEEYQDLVKQFKERERAHHHASANHDRGPWYIRVDGKIYKQKGQAKVFDWKKGANNYALAMIKNRPDLDGKIKLTKNPVDNQEQITPPNTLEEKWSQKYKSSINCSHPKGFSQRAHCAGKKKHNESMQVIEMTCPDCGMCEAHSNMTLQEIKKGQKDSNGFTKCWPGHHAAGTKKGKNGGIVRNCVPNESVAEGGGAQQAAIAIAKKKSGKYDKEGKRIKESATVGATSSANIGTVVSPHLAIGKKKGKKSYTGTPGHSGTTAPKPPKIIQKKKKDGTAVNALDMKGTSLFGGPSIKRR